MTPSSQKARKAHNPHPPHKHHPHGCLVKRAGHTEHYDERKVYASCYAACLSTQIHPREAERISNAVSREVTKWATSQKGLCISADAIFEQTARILRKHHEDVAFMYATHRDVS